MHEQYSYKYWGGSNLSYPALERKLCAKCARLLPLRVMTISDHRKSSLQTSKAAVYADLVRFCHCVGEKMHCAN
jgi:hypothetical protein